MCIITITFNNNGYNEVILSDVIIFGLIALSLATARVFPVVDVLSIVHLLSTGNSFLCNVEWKNNNC